ncbi:MAG: hypothetical protein MZW92_47735 [Comamonadaceae bacterium]|nr:hypothetical protein [Comamonadaceae bacterium]
MKAIVTVESPSTLTTACLPLLIPVTRHAVPAKAWLCGAKTASGEPSPARSSRRPPATRNVFALPRAAMKASACAVTSGGQAIRVEMPRAETSIDDPFTDTGAP